MSRTKVPNLAVDQAETVPALAEHDSYGETLAALGDIIDDGDAQPWANLRINRNRLDMQTGGAGSNVDQWAAVLGLPTPRHTDEYPADAHHPNGWYDYRTQGTWRGWPIEIWTAVDLPAKSTEDGAS